MKVVHYVLHAFTLLQCLVLASCQRPNIVFFLADDLGWNDVGFHNDRVRTPQLDLLAYEGLRLNSSYALPVCGPSRHALLTGRYPMRDGMQRLIVFLNDPACSPLDISYLPERMKDLGYRTHLIGKWHLGACNEQCRPTARGFDSFLGYLGAGTEHYYHNQTVFDFWKDDRPATEYNGRHSTDVFTDGALEIIANHDQKDPLFLTVSYAAPHFPIQTPQQYEDMYADVDNVVRRKYLGMVTHMDESIGRVRAALTDRGMGDNTIIVFTSDNGGQNRYGANNYPLAGDKNSLWEGGTRVPTVVAGAGVQPGVSQGLFHISDWFPTLLAAAGDESAPVQGHATDGVSQWGMLSRGEPSSRQEMLYHIDDDPISSTTGNAAIRVGRYKLIRGFAGSGTFGLPTLSPLPAEACQTLSDPPPGCAPHNMSIGFGTDFKYFIGTAMMLAAADQSILRLYDLEEDPNEENEISADFPEMTSFLVQRLLTYGRQMGLPVNPGNEGIAPEDWITENGTLGRNWCSLDLLTELRVNSIRSIPDLNTSFYDGDVFTPETTTRMIINSGATHNQQHGLLSICVIIMSLVGVFAKNLVMLIG